MRIALVALGLVLLSAPSALAGVIPDPGNACPSYSACYDRLGTVLQFAYYLSIVDTDVVGHAAGCANSAIACALLPSTICLVGQL